LKESGRLKMKGKELIEDKFVFLRKFWRRQVVEPFAGARYFGEPYKVPNSDHFSIAKPRDDNDDPHRLLVQFIKDSDDAFAQQTEGDRIRRLALKVETIEKESLIQLEHFEREITNALLHLDNHAKLIAEDTSVSRFLMNSANKSAQAKTHRVLLNHADIGLYATTFILNRDGRCVENSRHELSIGKDYSFRPYFLNAMQNRIGRFPAIGVTSGALGYHVGYPVRDGGKIIGVACVEVDMEEMAAQSKAFVRTESRGGDCPWIRVLADENGVIMLSTEPSWKYRALAKIPDEIFERLRQATQYPGQDLEEIERFESPETMECTPLEPAVTVRGLHWKTFSGDEKTQVFAVRETKIPVGWKVLIFWRLAIPP
jgi:C4-dicarboxylate-specific signal transduction histidine kinase